MQFINHTPFPALAFGGVDQRQQAFHVVALRQTLTWNDAGELILADEQAPLCEADSTFGDDLTGVVRQESDLCQYKPRCDVIINATAYPPQQTTGVAPRRFDVRVVIKRPDAAVAPPAEPEGLNPHMRASQEALQQWREAVAQTARRSISGQRLIDKALTVTGERAFVKRAGLIRFCAAALRLGTLGSVRISPWRLTVPKPATPVPVRLDRAFGGECLIGTDDPAAMRVAKKWHLSAEQAANHPAVISGNAIPVAHDAFAANPVGLGFATDWYLNATRRRRVAAPQIESPEHPLDARTFNLGRAGKAEDAVIAGLGVRPKGHPGRAKLAGTIDQAFIESDAPLPDDFDFAVWNAAWPDQQIDVLQGDELIELTNLCTPDTPGANRDLRGNTVLRLGLPGDLPFVLVRYQNGALGELAARLDTLLIEPDQRQVSCVWRATVATTPAIRVLEARMLTREQVSAFKAQTAEAGHG